MAIEAARLVGAWRLLDWHVDYPDGRRVHPFGADADGLLLYGADGWMSAAMWTRRRTPWSAPSARQADVASKARSLDEYLGYAGRWRVAGDTIHHDILSSANPALIGSEQVRTARFDGERLLLGALERDAAGASRQHVILWERAAPSR